MWKEVERLEDDPDAAPDGVDIGVPAGDLLSVQVDPARVDPLQQVDATEQRRLARAGGSDQTDDLVLADVEIDAAEYLDGAERLVHAFEFQGSRSRAHCPPPALWRRRSRAISQSVSRASGIVSRMKSSAVAM